ncbi:hypothetical protein BAUCODRAFT_151683 [Baudoinia panamericana UAMH 10762]|uniref:Uncharacterized protein n=1 Tax=Baudoinia panamericana (strain UAMH 10762) TaxID=717646 RepID=M2N011_BAUPA|nr:uncharacterized protein BAUCODRAFT_151683 [Baudoinia panamericana UAMH 10762]EMC92264.1 hypothetical protein BAUCODRAFT_151683 [Baudoinia panamericana UAMH 10762]
MVPLPSHEMEEGERENEQLSDSDGSIQGVEEYHTEEEDDDDGDGGDENELAPTMAQKDVAPYLPAHLLTAQPTEPVREDALSEPWESMTRPQKRGRQARLRQRRKKQLKRLQDEAGANGVLEAGRLAQGRRGVASKASKSHAKDARPVLSGRQQMLEQRKRQRGTEQPVRRSVRAKTGSKR